MTFAYLVDVIQKAAAAFALAVGGAWVLMNYVRNRTHVPRLQVELKAHIVERGNRRYILAMIQVKNPGLSKITLTKKSGPLSALLVSPLVDYEHVPSVVSCNWREATAFDVLVHHDSIEPGLALSEEKLLRLPENGPDAFWLRLRVVAHHNSWSADAIALASSVVRDAPFSLKKE